MFERGKGLDFKQIYADLILALGYDFKIVSLDKILVSGFKTDKDKKDYDLYYWNPVHKQVQYLLYSHLKYGYSSNREIDNVYLEKVAPIGISGYCDYLGDKIYFVWCGNLEIMEITPGSSEIKYFGVKTPNYVTPQVTTALLNAYKQRSKTIYQSIQKMSFVTGIFSDDECIGLVYANYNPKMDAWQTVVQFYSTQGKFLGEQILEKAIQGSYYPDPCFFYSREKNRFYFLSHKQDNELEDIFSILTYSLEK